MRRIGRAIDSAPKIAEPISISTTIVPTVSSITLARASPAAAVASALATRCDGPLVEPGEDLVHLLAARRGALVHRLGLLRG